MPTIDEIHTMSPDQRAALEKNIARKIALRIAGMLFLKIATARLLRVAADRSYQSDATEH